MLTWIITASLRHRGVVLALSGVLVAVGAWSMSRLPIDAFPDVTDVLVQVNTVAPALSPMEIEKQITVRVEQSMGGLTNLKLVRSISKYGLSQVTVVFEDGTDLHFARSQVMQRLGSVELPEGIERPTLGPIATGLGEIYHYVITAPSGDLTDSRVLHDWVVKPILLSVPGVAEVNSWGGFEKQFQVVADPTRLVRHGLSLGSVLDALERSNANVGGGSTGAAGEILLVSGRGVVSTTRDIGDITVSAKGGRPVRIRDVAEVVEGHELRRGVVTTEGRGEAVLGLGFMLMGENSHVVAERLRARMEDVRKAVPPGTSIRVVYDRTELVDLVIRTVKENLFQGALLVVAVLFLFMGHLRAALIVAAAIPLSMLFAFNFMLQAGIAGTLMSLGAVDFGMVVDSSVVMVENSIRRLDEDPPDRPVRDVVAEASMEVRKPTLFGEAIIAIVYLPILALEGVEGKLFRPMALTVIFALLGSMLLSLTLMPVLASLFLGRRKGRGGEPWIVRAAKRLYAPVLEFAISHRVLVLGSVLIFVLGTIPIASRLGSIFVPRLDEGSIVINTIRLPGVSIDESARFGTRIEWLLKAEFPDEIASIWTRTGTPEVATDPMGIEVSDVFIMLRPRERWRKASTKDDLQAAMDRVLRRLPGMNYSFTQPIEMRFNEMVSGVRTDLGVKVFGDDFDVLKEKAERVREVLAAIPGAANPFVEPMVGQPVLEVNLKPDALSRHGLRARDVLDWVEALGGREAGEVRVGDRRFPLAVRLPAVYESDPARLRTLLLPLPDGQRLPLSAVAEVVRTSGPMVVHREWGKRRALVTCNVVGRDLGSFVAEARRKVDDALESDVGRNVDRVEFGGQFENLIRASKRLAVIVPVALALILLLLFATYGNLVDCFRVFLSIPFAALGGVWALHLRDMPFSISAGIGFIALSGVSVLDDMVMVSTIRLLMGRGMPALKATREAALRRLRPVLMTTLVAGLGFIPMAVNTGVGAEVQRPLATVLVGGLVTGTLLTLLILPTLFVTLRRGGHLSEGSSGAMLAATPVPEEERP
jgi:cobalt-zinc-cadmium resistance protein CzcA